MFLPHREFPPPCQIPTRTPCTYSIFHQSTTTSHPKTVQIKLQRYTVGIITNRKHRLIQINAMFNHFHICIGIFLDLTIPDLVKGNKTNAMQFINRKTWWSVNLYGRRIMSISYQFWMLVIECVFLWPYFHVFHRFEYGAHNLFDLMGYIVIALGIVKSYSC